MNKDSESVRYTSSYMSDRKSVQIERGRESWERKRQEFREVMASIPSDTRSLTGRLMGDPLYERSSLYRSRQKNG